MRARAHAAAAPPIAVAAAVAVAAVCLAALAGLVPGGGTARAARAARGAQAGNAELAAPTAGARASTARVPWFAPYVDVTQPPIYPFASPSANPAKAVVLSFVVSAGSAPCTPTWGGLYTLASASRTIGLDRRIARLRAQGGRVIVSFGGALGSELAVSCDSQAELSAAYLAVVRRYRLSTIDLDIEGGALGDVAASHRRALAIAAVQRELAAAGRSLSVWLTLPVGTAGLGPQAKAVVRGMLSAGVRLAGVNAMTMDYGSPGEPIWNVAGMSEAALRAAHRQLRAIYRRAGMPLGVEAAWHMIGATVMIGHSDVEAEVLTLTEARRLEAFAKARGLGRVSMWSLSRDVSCTPAQFAEGQPSALCSGVRQRPRQFSRIFGG